MKNRNSKRKIDLFGNKFKVLLFSLLPTVVIFGSIEVIFRLVYTVKPTFITAPLPDELRGLSQPDADLFWSLVPKIKLKEPNGAKVNINSMGFRGEELPKKTRRDYRILSLGESSTFGAGVADNETYSAILEKSLEERILSRNIQVLNCGVSAYSSFQGLQYLSLRGLNYEPDMVLVYFEINDYMPSTFRNHGLDELSAELTDEALYNSQLNRFSTHIIRASRFLTFINYRYAAWRVRKLGLDQAENPFREIGIQNPSYIAGRLAVEKNGKMVRPKLNEYNLGQRVSEKERVANFASFRKICDEKGIQIVIIHPAYLNTSLHDCVLTEFCKQSETSFFESFYSLHPDSTNRTRCFFDNMHPNKEGHRNLALDLADFIAPMIEKSLESEPKI